MKDLHFVLVFLLIIVCTSVLADSLREIELHDGSMIAGEVVNFSNGVYTIESNSLGTVKLEDAKIKAIRSPSAGTVNNATSASTVTELLDIQKRVMSDQSMLDSVMALQNDPEVQAVLNDPVIMNMILSGDLTSLQSNPKIIKLMNKPNVRQIVDQVK